MANDPTGLDVNVIITSGSYLGLMIPDHVAVNVINSKEDVLYDPAGSFPGTGSGQMSSGQKEDIQKYIEYHQTSGSSIEVYSYQTSLAEDSKIISAIEKQGGVTSGMCAIASCEVLSASDKFKDLSASTPAGIEEQLLSMDGGSCGF